MQITREADYATRVVLYLTQIGSNHLAVTKDVAQAQKIPPYFLVKIISRLASSGILHTSRGIGGGLKLARAPKDITLLDIILAIDGPIRLNQCVDPSERCAFEENCPMQSVWSSIQESMINKLRKINFEQLIMDKSVNKMEI